MNTPTASSSRSTWSKFVLIAAAALGLCFVAATAVNAADDAKPAAEKGKSLPLTATFEKGADSETGPYVLTLKNDSEKPVKATAKVLLSVAFHADSKARNVPEQEIAPGKTMTIRDLSAGDKVTVTAKGYAPLELTVK